MYNRQESNSSDIEAMKRHLTGTQKSRQVKKKHLTGKKQYIGDKLIRQTRNSLDKARNTTDKQYNRQGNSKTHTTQEDRQTCSVTDRRQCNIVTSK